MPAPAFSVSNCLILQSKQPLHYLPSSFSYYFINSRRRFLLYFRHRAQMLQAMRIFQDQAVRFYQRESLLPDRQELEEQGFHCNYRHKRQDLRRLLSRETPYNEPRSGFQRYQRVRQEYRDNNRQANQQGFKQTDQQANKQVRNQQQKKQVDNNTNDSKNVLPIQQSRPSRTFSNKSQEIIKPNPFTNMQVAQILNNKELIRSILLSFSS